MAVYFGQNLVLLDKLASGGMGEVYRARQVGTGGFQKIVAVKRILPQYAVRPDFASMFKQEMNLSAKLQHPNIIQVFSNGHESGYLYLVMEYVKGKTVAEMLIEAKRRGIRIPPEVSCFIASETARGLAYAHNLQDDEQKTPLGIVHRDISPQNIMLGYQGEVKVLDFGIAKIAGVVEGTRDGDLKGKVPYVAPEYVEYDQLDYRADIFALGVVFHELLSQRPLFVADSTYKTLRNVVEMPIPPLVEQYPDVRFELENIVARALERDTNERFQSAEEFARQIAVFANKVYPNFTRGDFAKFVVTLFADQEDPELADLREIHGYSKRVPANLVEAQTELHLDKGWKREGARNYPLFDLSNIRPIFYWVLAFFLISLLAFLSPALFKGKDRQKELLLPTALSALVTWFDVNTIEVDENGIFLRWEDLSALGNSAISETLATTPKLIELPEETDKLLKKALYFDGQDDYLVINGVTDLVRQTKAVTVIVVAKADTPTLKEEQPQYIFSNQAQDKTFDIFRGGVSFGDRLRLKIARDPGMVLYEDTPPQNLTKPFIFSSTIGEEEAQVYLGDKLLMKRAIRMPLIYSESHYFTLGQAFDHGKAANFFKGQLFEFILYSRVIKAEELAKLVEYLRDKYQIYY
jgi:serine/threonine-protein kinase